MQAFRIQALEAFAHLQRKDAGDHRQHQHQRGGGKFHHQRHASHTHRRQNQAIFQAEQPDYLANQIAPRDHHQATQQHDRKCECQIFPRQGTLPGGGGQHHHHREARQSNTRDQGRTNAKRGINTALQIKAPHKPMQRIGDQHRLGAKGNRRRHVKPRRTLHIALPRGSECKQRALRGEGIDHRRNPPLVKQHEG